MKMLFVVCESVFLLKYFIFYDLLHYFDSYTTMVALFFSFFNNVSESFLWEKVCHYLPGNKGEGRDKNYHFGGDTHIEWPHKRALTGPKIVSTLEK